MIKALSALIAALPEILKLIKTIQARIDEAEAERRLKDDIKKINDAFESQDAEALNEIFNS